VTLQGRGAKGRTPRRIPPGGVGLPAHLGATMEHGAPPRTRSRPEGLSVRKDPAGLRHGAAFHAADAFGGGLTHDGSRPWRTHPEWRLAAQGWHPLPHPGAWPP